MRVGAQDVGQAWQRTVTMGPQARDSLCQGSVSSSARACHLCLWAPASGPQEAICEVLCPEPACRKQ